MRALVPADLIKFFSALARRVPCPVKLTLTGGSEAMLLGGTRPTGDLDFELALPPGCARLWRAVEEAVAAAAAETAVTVQYSADIDRWSSIAVPTAKRRTRLRRRVGRVAVHLLEPRCWAVYKLARYLDADVEDLRAVLRRQRVPSLGLARLCGESLRASPRSTQLFLFRQHVEHFFRAHGRAIWGAGFRPETAVAAFGRAAGIVRPQPPRGRHRPRR